jgi:pimeloyl-ACP methyl ester carboxylesterase
LLVGPVAPEIEQRRAIQVPMLIIGHENDLIHPFSDAENLAQQTPNARLVQADSMYELRWKPERLTQEIVRFVADAFSETEKRPASAAGLGERFA